MLTLPDILMSTEFYIAGRMAGDKTSGSRLSRLMTRIAVVSVALSIAVMIIAIAVTKGFQSEIRDKAVGLTGHIILSNYDANATFETNPVDIALADIPGLLTIKGVLYAQPVATKGGIIKTGADVQGSVLKGVDATFNPRYFEDFLLKGEVPVFNDSVISNNVLIPLSLSKRLRLDIGDHFDMYFIQEPPRARRFTVAGIYNAPFDDISDSMILGDIRHIRRLNGWTSSQAGAVEVFIDDIRQLDVIAEEVNDHMSAMITTEGRRLKVQTVVDFYEQLFDWLSLFDMNMVVVLVLVLLVAGCNMISGLLILVFEKTAMVGLLKALGMRNAGVQKVFLYRASFITLRGLLWGNVLALSLYWLQQQFQLFPLNPANYYLSSVPVLLHFQSWLAVNILGFAGITLLLALPVLVISYISPDKTIKS